jgi:N6-L-threonylcarbamoyladenine synthase
MPGDVNFSFSGLKTAVRYLLPKLSLDRATMADLCASFQQAIFDVLVRKTVQAAQKYSAEIVAVSGGVSGNAELRRQLSDACRAHGLHLKTAEPRFCTDNAAMIAFAAAQRLHAGAVADLTQEIDPNLALTSVASNF